jgi:hypothetical protein
MSQARGYAPRMQGAARVRGLSVVVPVLLIALCLFSFASVCVCALSDHPGQTVERVIASTPLATVPVLQLWGGALAVLVLSTVVVGRTATACGRASPASLQCFRF